MSRLINNILNEEFEKPPTQEIFKDINKISLDYVPDNLPYREAELTRLAQLFRDVLGTFNENAFESTLIIVSGDRKSGKTVTTKRFGLDLVKFAQSKKFKSKVHLTYRHVNCIRYRTVYSIFISVIQSFVPEFPIRGFSTFELIKYLKEYLEVSNLYLLLTLDDVQALAGDKDYETILLSLIDNEILQYDNFRKRISIIVINNKKGHFENLGNLSNIQLKQNTVHFQEYTPNQLKNILLQRARETLIENTYQEKDIAKIIALIINQQTQSMDPRLALEILWRSARIAQQKGLSTIQVDEIKTTDDIPIENTNIELSLKAQEKVILFVIARIFLANPEQSYTKIKEIKREFDRIKLNLDISFKTLGYTSIFNYLQELKKLNLIVTQVTNPQKKGRSTIIKLNILPSHVDVLLRNQLLKPEQDLS